MGDQRGFTIIEVILFLAITGLLLFGALQSVGTSVNNSRYTDTLKSMQDYLQSQYNEVQTNVSHRESTTQGGDPLCLNKTPGASDTCIIMGKLIDIDKNTSTLRVYTVVGDVNADGGTSEGNCGTGGAGKVVSIALHCPRVVFDGPNAVLDDTYTPAWGADITALNYVTSSSTPFNRIAFLRDPDSEASYIVTYDDNTLGAIDPSFLVNSNTNRPVVMCLQGSSPTNGFVFFSGASTLSSIQTSSDTSVLDPVLRSVC